MSYHAGQIELRDGQLLFVKRGHDRDRHLREARTLRELGHPNVVHLVGHRTTSDGEEVLELSYVSDRSWQTHPPHDLDELLSAAIVVANVIAELHAAGVVHGRIDASHVLWARGGQPILCGFSDARRAGSETIGHHSADPAFPRDTTVEPTLDVHELAALLEDTLASIDVGGDRRAKHLRRLVHACQDSDPTARPDAARMVAWLEDAGSPRGSPAAHGRFSAIAAVAALVAIAGTWFVADGLARPSPTPVGQLAASAPADPSTSTRIHPVSSTTASTSRPATPSTTRPTMPSTDTVGPPPTSVVTRIDFAGATYEIRSRGAAFVELGDWDCDGVATPAVVRVTREVHVFDDWADEQVVAARHVADVPGPGFAHATSVSIDTEGCAHLHVSTDSGDHEVRW